MCYHSTNKYYQQHQSSGWELTYGDVATKGLKNNNKKVVSFSPNVRVKRTLHITNYSKQEVKTTWFQASDYKRIHDEINHTVELMERRTTTGCIIDKDDDVYCARGLEPFTIIGSQRKLRNKINAIDVVLAAQDIQYRHNNNEGRISNPEILCDLYKRFSIHCLVTAQMMGLIDEKIVLNIK